MTTIEMCIRNTYDNLSKAEKAVAGYFLDHMDDVFKYPLATLSQMSQTSQSSWSRFCKSVGYSGLKDLKKALFAELNENQDEPEISRPLDFADIKNGYKVSATIEQVRLKSIQAIETSFQLLDTTVLEQAAHLLIHAGSIRFFGIGASGLVAEDLYSKFLRLGYHVLYSKDFHTNYTLAATGTSRDAAIVISNSGETREILRIVKLLKDAGTPIIAITRYDVNNSLSQMADYVFYTNSTEILRRSGATSSRIAQLCIVDVLFMIVAGLDYDHIEENLSKSYDSCHPAQPDDH